MALLALAVAAIGCHSVYHRSHRLLAADPCAELKLRLDEASHAESEVVAAGWKVRDALRSGADAQALAFQLDRLEMNALDLRRRAASVADAAAGCASATNTPASAAKFQERSESFSAWVRQAREASTPTDMITTLETLLGGRAR